MTYLAAGARESPLEGPRRVVRITPLARLQGGPCVIGDAPGSQDLGPIVEGVGVILPTGTLERHGSHLRVSTDHHVIETPPTLSYHVTGYEEKWQA